MCERCVVSGGGDVSGEGWWWRRREAGGRIDSKGEGLTCEAAYVRVRE